MKRQRSLFIIILGILCGILLAFTYINPYNEQTTLSELVLQLSGSRGEFALGLSFTELISFNLKIVPYFLFELYIGIDLYRHFCTASVYVFSRTPDRISWYIKESGIILLSVVMYQFMLFLSAILTTYCRYEIVWDFSGFALLAVHAIFYVLWLFSMTLLVNVLSILISSEVAFALTIGGQAVLITMLSLLNMFEDNKKMLWLTVNANPFTHLVLGWQNAFSKGGDDIIHTIGNNLSLFSSFLYIVCIAVLIFVVGGLLVQKRNIIVADTEFGGV